MIAPSASSVDSTAPAAIIFEPAATDRIGLMHRGFVNIIGKIATGIIGLLLVPFILHRLGFEEYGLWLAASAVLALVGSTDAGFQWSIPREIARQGNMGSAAEFVIAAGNVCAMLGLASACVVALLGASISRHLHVSPAMTGNVAAVFLIASLCCVANQFVRFGTACLEGLQRFDLSNLIAVAQVVVRAGGIVVLLMAGMRIVAFVAWYAITEVAAGLAFVIVVARAQPAFRFRLRMPRWASLRPRLGFGLLSEACMVLVRIAWETPPLIIGLLLGSANIVPFFVGQKFPSAASVIHDRMGAVILPASSASDDGAQSTDVLVTGTRSIAVIAMPLCLVFVLLAPWILQAWLGPVPPAAIPVLRWFAVAVLLDGIGSCALHLLWGRGSVRKIFLVLVGVAAIAAGGTAMLVPRFGVAGAAWSMLAALGSGTAAYIVIACRAVGLKVNALLRAAGSGVWAAWAVCAVVLAGLRLVVAPAGRLALVLGVAAAGVIYLAALSVLPGCGDEVAWMRAVIGNSRSGGKTACERAVGIG